MVPLVPVLAVDNDPIARMALEQPKERQLNRFGVSYSAGFNINAKFSGLGAGNASGAGAGPATGGNVDRVYDDGYNKVRVGGNIGGFTWNYGYKNASQYDPAANEGSGTLTMHSTSVTPTKTGDIDGDPQHGFQFTYTRELGRSKNDRWVWGAEVGFGYTDVRINDSRPYKAGTKTITDVYDVGGIDPSGDPTSSEYPQHAGTPEGPGPSIPDAPDRTEEKDPTGSRITGNRHFDADMYVFRFGPYIEFPIVEKLRGVVSGGFAVGVIAGHLQFRETDTVIATDRASKTRAEADNADSIVGAYLSALVLYPLNDRWSVFAGGQVYSMESYSVSAGGRKMKLDVSAAPFITTGISYSF
jgi:hypothetical protein